jgi:porin
MRSDRKRWFYLAVAGAFAFSAGVALGQESPSESAIASPIAGTADDSLAEPEPERPSAAANPYAGDLSTRIRMTGDWGGSRAALAERGLTFDLFATQFYQGIASGGQEQEWEYGGKLDYLLNVEAGKLGLWEGLYANLHAETRFGNDVNGIDGLIAPSNIPMNVPDPVTHVTSITGLKFVASSTLATTSLKSPPRLASGAAFEKSISLCC